MCVFFHEELVRTCLVGRLGRRDATPGEPEERRRRGEGEARSVGGHQLAEVAFDQTGEEEQEDGGEDIEAFLKSNLINILSQKTVVDENSTRYTKSYFVTLTLNTSRIFYDVLLTRGGGQFGPPGLSRLLEQIESKFQRLPPPYFRG